MNRETLEMNRNQFVVAGSGKPIQKVLQPSGTAQKSGYPEEERRIKEAVRKECMRLKEELEKQEMRNSTELKLDLGKYYRVIQFTFYSTYYNLQGDSIYSPYWHAINNMRLPTRLYRFVLFLERRVRIICTVL